MVVVGCVCVCVCVLCCCLVVVWCVCVCVCGLFFVCLIVAFFPHAVMELIETASLRM